MRDKNVTSPKLRQAAYELERNAICKQILSSASRELYLHLPYLDMALASLLQEHEENKKAGKEILLFLYILHSTSRFLLFFH